MDTRFKGGGGQNGALKKKFLLFIIDAYRPSDLVCIYELLIMQHSILIQLVLIGMHGPQDRKGSKF